MFIKNAYTILAILLFLSKLGIWQYKIRLQVEINVQYLQYLFTIKIMPLQMSLLLSANTNLKFIHFFLPNEINHIVN